MLISTLSRYPLWPPILLAVFRALGADTATRECIASEDVQLSFQQPVMQSHEPCSIYWRRGRCTKVCSLRLTSLSLGNGGNNFLRRVAACPVYLFRRSLAAIAPPGIWFLCFHFIMTLLMIRRDNLPKYKKHLLNLPSQKPFANLGHYLRHSILLVLSQHVGDFD